MDPQADHVNFAGESTPVAAVVIRPVLWCWRGRRFSQAGIAGGKMGWNENRQRRSLRRLFSFAASLSTWWLVRLDAQEIGENAALLGSEDVLVVAGVEHRLALVERNAAQILEGLFHQRLPI